MRFHIETSVETRRARWCNQASFGVANKGPRRLLKGKSSGGDALRTRRRDSCATARRREPLQELFDTSDKPAAIRQGIIMIAAEFP